MHGTLGAGHGSRGRAKPGWRKVREAFPEEVKLGLDLDVQVAVE